MTPAGILLFAFEDFEHEFFVKCEASEMAVTDYDLASCAVAVARAQRHLAEFNAIDAQGKSEPPRRRLGAQNSPLWPARFNEAGTRLVSE